MNIIAKANRRLNGRAQRGYISRVATLSSSLRLEKATKSRLCSLTIEGSSQIGENGILNMSEATIKLGGANLFNLLDPRFSGRATISQRTDRSITVKGDSSWCSANILVPSWERLVGKKLTISGTISKSSSAVNAGLYVRWFNGNLGIGDSNRTIGVYGKGADGYITATGTLEGVDLERYPNAQLCVALYYNTDGTGYDGTEEITYTDIMLSVDGRPYEPYIAPQEVKIPTQIALDDGTERPLRLGRVGGRADAIEVQGTHNKVWYLEAFPEPSGTPDLESQEVYDTPIKHDITDTELGRGLLALKLNNENMSLSVYSSLDPSKLEATFYSTENPEMATLTINYACKGRVIKEARAHRLRRGSGFEAHSIHIDGYKPITSVIRGVATDDSEITFYYERSTK